MKLKIFALLAGLMLFLLTLTACSGSSAPSQPFPTGTFVDNATSQRGYIFNSDGTWKYFMLGTGTIGATGTYTVDGNQWTDAGSNECTAGMYEWSYDGTTLSFKVIGEDDCSARKSSLDGHTFTLKN